jgi:hypothetical protein
VVLFNTHFYFSVFFWIAALTLAVIMTYLPANCDIGWLTYATGSWLNGDILYRDIFEVNPPLVFYVMAPGVWLAGLIGADEIVTYKATIGMFALGVLAFSSYLLRPFLIVYGNVGYFVVAASGLIYAFILPGNTDIYSQREHIFMLAILPYLIVSIPDKAYNHTKKTHFFTALLAAFGLCLKPHFFLIWLAVELFHWFSKTGIARRAAYLMVIPSCAFAYAGLAVMLHPEYFTELAPIAAQSYGAHRFPSEHVWSKLLSAIAPVSFFLVLSGGVHKPDNSKAHAYFLCLIMAACLITLSQFKGWNYTYLPPIGMVLLYLAFILLENTHRSNTSNSKPTPGEQISAIVFMASTAALLYLIYFEPHNQWRFLLSPLIFFLLLLFAFRLHYALTVAYPRRRLALAGAAITLVAILLIAQPISRAAAYFWLLLPWWWAFCLMLLVALLVGLYIKSTNHNNFVYNHTMSVCGAVLVLMVLCFNHYTYYRGSQSVYTSSLMETLIGEVKKYPDTEHIYLFNIGIYPAFPLNNLVKKDWAGRFHQLWMIPAAYSDPEHCVFNSKGEAIMAWTVKNMMEDFRRQSPDMVFFDESRSHIFKTQERFDFIQCLSYFPEFTQWLAGYQQVSGFDLCDESGKSYECRFTVWRRRG